MSQYDIFYAQCGLLCEDGERLTKLLRQYASGRFNKVHTTNTEPALKMPYYDLKGVLLPYAVDLGTLQRKGLYIEDAHNNHFIMHPLSHVIPMRIELIIDEVEIYNGRYMSTEEKQRFCIGAGFSNFKAFKKHFMFRLINSADQSMPVTFIPL